MVISAEAIAERVQALGRARRLIVAFSGGPDSHVLLHALACTGDHGGLSALHVNHRLHPDADRWAAHCADVCDGLAVDLTVATAPDKPPSGAGETWAREVRYQLFAEHLRAGDLLLTAHHRDDQAETVLLRLLRGAGPTGLAGIPACRSLGRGQVGRPLLDCARSDIKGYAQAHGLASLQDPGNANMQADRNLLRHRVLPLLRERWPSAPATLSRSAALMDEHSTMLSRYARSLCDVDAEELDSESVRRLDSPERKLVLRQWLLARGLSLPDARQLTAGCEMLLDAGLDKVPLFRWPGGSVRRYRGRLQAFKPDINGSVESPAPATWCLDGLLTLPGGHLEVAVGMGGLDPGKIPTEGVVIGYRGGGERCRPVGRPSRPLKKLFQEAGVPQWHRMHWPLLTVAGEIVAVPGICVCEGWQVTSAQQGLNVTWHPR